MLLNKITVHIFNDMKCFTLISKLLFFLAIAKIGLEDSMLCTYVVYLCFVLLFCTYVLYFCFVLLLCTFVLYVLGGCHIREEEKEEEKT